MLILRRQQQLSFFLIMKLTYDRINAIKRSKHMIKIIRLNQGNGNLYELYSKAYSWDKNNYCFPSKELSEFLGLFRSHYALYEDDNFIGYGIHHLHIPINPNVRIVLNSLDEKEETKKEIKTPLEPSKINLAYIIHPEYRHQGYGTKLVNYLIEKAEEKKNYDLIEVEILKKNVESISLIEKFDFEFKYFDDNKIVFQKTIKK